VEIKANRRYIGKLSCFSCIDKQNSYFFLSRWDNSAAQLMVQLQNNISNGFCTNIQKVQSLYILSADADQLFGQGMDNFAQNQTQIEGLSDYKICTATNLNVFLSEFLTKIHSTQLYSCQKSYDNRFDIKLQQCLRTYGLG
jgi:hypothetical protein